MTDTPRRVVVAEGRSGTLGGGLDVVAVRGEAAPVPQAHRTAPYRPRYSLDQRAAGQYRWRADAGTPVAECIRKSELHSLPGAGQGRRTRACRALQAAHPTRLISAWTVSVRAHVTVWGFPSQQDHTASIPARVVDEPRHSWNQAQARQTFPHRAFIALLVA